MTQGFCLRHSSELGTAAVICDLPSMTPSSPLTRVGLHLVGVVLQALVSTFGAAAAARAQEPPPKRICLDFESDVPGQLPENWEAHSDGDSGPPPYEVATDGAGRYLAARDRGQSVILARKLPVDIDRYPLLTFRWRVFQIPKGGDERFGPTGDSAAGVYVNFNFAFGLIPIAVKYVWSSTLPVGTALKRSGTGRPWIIVAASGSQGLGEWHRFVFDVRAAYRETYGGRPPRQIVGVGLLSDANATHSTAFADYDDICFLSRAEGASSGIRDIVKAD